MSKKFASTKWLWLLVCLCCSPLIAQSTKPNVVIFVLDDVGQSDIGAFGNSIVNTPNIDKLAREGTRFTNAFLTTSSCSSSRASLITGLYPVATGAPNLDDPLPASVVSLPQLLREAGYYTESVGKWHLGEPFKSHFDRVVEPHEESGSVDWIPELRNRPHDKPFFFWLASKDAHTPYEDWHAPLVHQNPAQVPVPKTSDDNAFVREAMAGYYDEIARADRNIGAVLGELRKEGVLDNTLVMVLSDNGSIFGGAKTTLYDEGIKTPLVMRFPQYIPANVVNEQLVSAVDLMPTILSVAGLPPVQNAPGVSLWPTLKNPQVAVRDYIYAARNKHGHPLFARAIRTRTYLYKRNYLNRRLCDPLWDSIFEPNKPRNSNYAEFYDLERDPQQQVNEIDNAKYAAPLAEAREKMNTIMAETNQNPPSLILEACPHRSWSERIAFKLSGDN